MKCSTFGSLEPRTYSIFTCALADELTAKYIKVMSDILENVQICTNTRKNNNIMYTKINASTTTSGKSIFKLELDYFLSVIGRRKRRNALLSVLDPDYRCTVNVGHVSDPDHAPLPFLW